MKSGGGRSCRAWPTVTPALPQSVASDSAAGQLSAVTAGPFDTGQAHRTEPAQPLQQAGLPGRGSRELGHAQQPANGIERGSDMHIRVGVHAAGDGARMRVSLRSLAHAPGAAAGGIGSLGGSWLTAGSRIGVR